MIISNHSHGNMSIRKKREEEVEAERRWKKVGNVISKKRRKKVKFFLEQQESEFDIITVLKCIFDFFFISISWSDL